MHKVTATDHTLNRIEQALAQAQHDTAQPMTDRDAFADVLTIVQGWRKGIDTASSASRQHYIDTGRYLTHDETTAEAPAVPPLVDDAEDLLDEHGTQSRPDDLEPGDLFTEYGMDPAVVAARADWGDSVLVTSADGSEATVDCDTPILRIPATEYAALVAAR